MEYERFSFGYFEELSDRRKRGFDRVECLLLNVRIVPKTVEPRDFRLSSEPRHLPLCVVAMSLLRAL